VRKRSLSSAWSSRVTDPTHGSDAPFRSA
jgi:hypothetical protein